MKKETVTLISAAFTFAAFACFLQGCLACIGTRRLYYIADVPDTTPMTCLNYEKPTTKPGMLRTTNSTLAAVRERRLRTTAMTTTEATTSTTSTTTTSTTTTTTTRKRLHRTTTPIPQYEVDTTEEVTTQPTRRRPVRTHTPSTTTDWWEETTTEWWFRHYTGNTGPASPLGPIMPSSRADSCVTCGTIPAFANSIDGSQLRASAEEIPWQARILITTPQGQTRTCGGTLVANNYTILTAASCFDGGISDVSKITVILGELNRNNIAPEANEQVAVVRQVLKHRLYKNVGDSFDIALLKIKENKVKTDAIVPVCMPSKCREIQSTDRCYASGWKTTADCQSIGTQQLQKAVSFVWTDQQRCATLVKDQNAYLNTSRVICAQVTHPAKRGTCHADTGGPLVCRGANESRYTLEGVLAFHMNCEDPDRSVDVYYRACDFFSWFDDVLYGSAGLDNNAETARFPKQLGKMAAVLFG